LEHHVLGMWKLNFLVHATSPSEDGIQMLHVVRHPWQRIGDSSRGGGLVRVPGQTPPDKERVRMGLERHVPTIHFRGSLGRPT
jgi:hypothetical protein